MNAMYQDLKRLTIQSENQPIFQKWRPKFHLAPPVGWLNDPNGLCRMGDFYHVFYQYSPFDVHGGVKLWGHYQSKDLVHWTQMPAALFPDQPWDCHGVYSGSALVEEDTLYLYYTGNVKLSGAYDYIAQGREHNTCLAISRDGGATFPEKQLLMKNDAYPAGLTCHVRDPKVWQEGAFYYMLQGARTLENCGEVLLFKSGDKIHWTHCNTLCSDVPLGYMWECPDLYNIDGQTYLSISPQGLAREEYRFQNIYQSGFLTLEGHFDGEYHLGDFVEYDYGFDFYAPQTFEDHDRRILIAWMGMPDVEQEYTNPTVDLGWQHCLTVPRELFRKNGHLCQRPIEELSQLRKHGIVIDIHGEPLRMEATVFDLELERALKMRTAPFSIKIRNSALFRFEDGCLTLSFEKSGYGRTVRKAKVEALENLRILADESTLEIFANDGETVFTSRYYPEKEDTEITIIGNTFQGFLWGIHDKMEE